MMTGRNGHLVPDRILLAEFGELAADESARVEEHLARCPACRAEAEELRRAFEDFASDYRDYTRSVPPPPGRWQGFQPLLSELAASPASIPERARTLLADFGRRWRWMPAAVATAAFALLAVVTVMRFSHTQVASANELLKLAATAESDHLKGAGHAAVYQKLRVRVGPRTLTRVVIRDLERRRQVDQWSSPGAPPPIASQLAVQFHAAKLDWDNPLSPEGIGGWMADRATRVKAEEEVREDGRVFLLRSAAPTEPVSVAQFALRTTDYHPVSAHYQFRDRADDVELTEEAYEVRGIETLDPSIRSELSAPKMGGQPALAEALPAGPAGRPETSPADAEVEARYILHNHHADLGGETDLVLAGGAFVVTGVVIDAERKKELRTALEKLPGVRLDLHTAQEAAARQARSMGAEIDSAARARERVAALAEALGSRFPEQSSRDAFVLAMLEHSQAALARGFALQRLAARFTPSVESSLTPGSRRELRTIVTDHRRAMNAAISAVIEGLAPLTGVAPASADGAGAAGQWQEQPSRLVPCLQRLDRVVTQFVSGADGRQPDAAALVSEYRALVEQLAAMIAEDAPDLRR